MELILCTYEIGKFTTTRALFTKEVGKFTAMRATKKLLGGVENDSNVCLFVFSKVVS